MFTFDSKFQKIRECLLEGPATNQELRMETGIGLGYMGRALYKMKLLGHTQYDRGRGLHSLTARGIARTKYIHARLRKGG